MVITNQAESFLNH